jgi:hypothetical protein
MTTQTCSCSRSLCSCVLVEGCAAPLNMNICKACASFSLECCHATVLQDLARRSNLRQGVSCVVFNFDIQPHDLTQKEQAPGSVTTMLDVLQCVVLIDLCTAVSPHDHHLALSLYRDESQLTS